MSKPWEGIPEQFRPSRDKPWRVAWGFGAFRDFATEAEADAFVKAHGPESADPYQLIREAFHVDPDKGATHRGRK